MGSKHKEANHGEQQQEEEGHIGSNWWIESTDRIGQKEDERTIAAAAAAMKKGLGVQKDECSLEEDETW